MSGAERQSCRRPWPDGPRTFRTPAVSADPSDWINAFGGAHSGTATRQWIGSVQRLAGNQAVAGLLGGATGVQRDPVPVAEPAPPAAGGPGVATPESAGGAPEGSREPSSQERDTWGAWFPDMDFRIVRPAERGYNCYAWAVGLTDRIISSSTLMQANYQANVDGWTKYLADNHRFTPTGEGLDPNADLILYGDLPTMIYHAARKADAPFGRFTFSSKLGDGESPVILHDPADIQGHAYGKAQRSFKRL